MAESQPFENGSADSQPQAAAGGVDDGADANSPLVRDEISAKVRRSYELVPPIGSRWRWYDIPFRPLDWLLKSWRRRLLPWRARHTINRATNFLRLFEHYDRLKVAPLLDRHDNLIVPPDEKLTQGALWVVEFYPPSYYAQLQGALRKNGWDRSRYATGLEGPLAEEVTKARQRRGASWWRIGTVARPNSKFTAFGAKREVLPPEFELIELTATQIGRSLTAVVALILLSDQGQDSLNRVWKARHEPMLEWQGWRSPLVESRYFAAIRKSQRERQRIHDLARKWLGERCGGFFADSRGGQPVIDFNLFEKFDPTVHKSVREFADPIRALGMSEGLTYNYVSPQLPGLVLMPGEPLQRREELLDNCWSVVGAHPTVASLNDNPGYGDKPYSATTFAHMFDDEIRAFLLYTAVLRYASQLRETYAALRDSARKKHRRFSPKQIEQLRRELLSTSLDLPAVSRDTAVLWEPSWRQWDGLTITAEPLGENSASREAFDLIENMSERRSKAFDNLLAEDAAYRDVLSTAASLGASAADSRLGRRALLVAAASLLVALLSLLGSTDEPTIWNQLLTWLGRG